MHTHITLIYTINLANFLLLHTNVPPSLILFIFAGIVIINTPDTEPGTPLIGSVLIVVLDDIPPITGVTTHFVMIAAQHSRYL